MRRLSALFSLLGWVFSVCILFSLFSAKAALAQPRESVR